MTRTLFLAGRLIDGTGAAPIEQAAMLVEGARILAVGRAADIGWPDGTKLVEAETLMPGLIDVHVHLAYSGAKDPSAFRAESARIEYPRMALRAAKYAQDTLDHGYTAVRDMHAPGRHDHRPARCPWPRAGCGAPDLGLRVGPDGDGRPHGPARLRRSHELSRHECPLRRPGGIPRRGARPDQARCRFHQAQPLRRQPPRPAPVAVRNDARRDRRRLRRGP